MKSEFSTRSRGEAHLCSKSHNPKKRLHEEIKISDEDSDIEVIPYKQQRRSQETDYGPMIKEKLVNCLLWMKDKTMFGSFISSALKSLGYQENDPAVEVFEMASRSENETQPQEIFGSTYHDRPSRKKGFPIVKRDFQSSPLVHSTPFARVSHRRPLHELGSSSTHKLCNFCNTTSSGNHKCPEREAAEKTRKKSNAVMLLDHSEVFISKGRVSLGNRNCSPDIEFIREVPPSDILCSRTKLSFPCHDKATRRRSGDADAHPQASSNDAKTFTANEVTNEKEKEVYKMLLESYFIDGCWEPKPTEASFRNAHTQADLDCEVLEIRSKKEDISRYIEQYQKKPTYVKKSDLPKNKINPRPVFKTPPPPEEVLLLDDDTPFVFEERPRKPLSMPKASSTSVFFSPEWIADLKKCIGDETRERLKIVKEQEKQIQIVHEKRRQKLAIAAQIAETPEDDEFPELTPEMECIIREALSPSSCNEVLIQHKLHEILKKDMETLSNKNWLNDEIINMYFTLIIERSKQNGYPSAYAFNSFFYVSLKTKGYSAVRRWTRKVDIFSYEILLVPLHLGCHWCLAVIDFRYKTMKFFDSMSGKENCLEYLSNYIIEEAEDKKKVKYDLSNWTFEMVKDIPQQMNGYDCGMFALKYAEYLTRDAPITFTQENMQYFRQRMVYEIMTQKIL